MRYVLLLVCSGLILAPWLYLAGCSDDEDADDSDGGDDGSDSDADGDGDADGDTSNASCRYVDVVIAVDGSSSMSEEMEALREDVFPGFAQGITDNLEDLDDFRTATIDSCPDPANFHTRGNSGDCNFQGGNVWIESSSPNINDEFACVGDIFLGDINCSGNNDDEQPVSAACTALEPPFIENENRNFLRDEGILVVIAITDEDEQPTPNQSASEVFDRLVDIKGTVKNIVLLGIGGSRSCPDGAYGGAEEAVMLKQITDMFIAQDRGVWWDLCEGNIENGLDDALEIIKDACDEIDVE